MTKSSSQKGRTACFHARKCLWAEPIKNIEAKQLVYLVSIFSLFFKLVTRNFKKKNHNAFRHKTDVFFFS